jgi:hypothetical protein
VLELPTDLLLGDLRPVGSGQAGSLNGIGGGAERVRAHVAHGYCLTRGSGGRQGGRRSPLGNGDAPDEPATDLRGGVQLSPGVSPSSGDGSTRTIVGWSLGLEQPQDALGAVGGPSGDETPVRLAEGLGRSHPERAYGGPVRRAEPRLYSTDGLTTGDARPILFNRTV